MKELTTTDLEVMGKILDGDKETIAKLPSHGKRMLAGNTEENRKKAEDLLNELVLDAARQNINPMSLLLETMDLLKTLTTTAFVFATNSVEDIAKEAAKLMEQEEEEESEEEYTMEQLLHDLSNAKSVEEFKAVLEKSEKAGIAIPNC